MTWCPGYSDARKLTAEDSGGSVGHMFPVLLFLMQTPYAPYSGRFSRSMMSYCFHVVNSSVYKAVFPLKMIRISKNYLSNYVIDNLYLIL
jgi:hypothetical protein